MSLSASGPGGAVHPIGAGSGRRRTPAWVLPVVVVVVAVHVLVLLALARLGVIQAPLITPSERPKPMEMVRFRPTPPPPSPERHAERRPPSAAAHEAPRPQTETTTTVAVDNHPAPETATTARFETTPLDRPVEPPVRTAPPVIVGPQWISRPTPDQMARSYPAGAVEQSLDGRATLRCSVTVAGTMADCVVVDESPRGQGFGRAAMTLSRYFRISPRTEDGRPVGGAKVDIPIQFRL